MSGLLGNDGPGLLGKILANGPKSKERAGFSGTRVQNARGEWESIDKGLKGRQRKHRAKAVTPLSIGSIL